MATPTLIQHLAGGYANGSGDAFTYTLPNTVGSGNCLILGISYNSGSTPTVTDNNGNTWPGAATVTADAGAGKMATAIFILPNANAGKTTIKVTFGAFIGNFQMKISEFNNIATSSPVNGSSGQASQTGTTVGAGSFTPTNNNANGGNLIWYYCFPSGGVSTVTSTGFTPGTNFTLLDADIGWLAADTNGAISGSQYFVQATSAAINPSINPGDATNAFNCVAVALAAASAGTAKPAGIHIDRICHFTTQKFPANSTYKLQCPATGNLRLLTVNLGNTSGNNPSNITSVADSDGNNYTLNPTVIDSSFWYAVNTSADVNSNIITITTGSVTNTILSFRWWDISGALISPIGAAVNAAYQTGSAVTTAVTNATTATSSNVLHFASVPASVISPLFATDTTTFANIANNQKVVSTTSTSVTLDQNVDGTVANGDTISFGAVQTDFPIITPTGSNNLLVGSFQTDGGPTIGFYAGASTPTPAAAVFDYIGYIKENDNDTADNADAGSHYFNPNTTAVHWNWIYGRQAVSHLGGGIVEFKAAAVATPSPTNTVQGLIESEW